MDYFPVFEYFLSTQCGLTVNRASDKTVVFFNSFATPLASYDAKIDDFVKSMHASNSACPANGKILIPASEIVALEDLIFELGNRERCGALPVLAMIQALDVVQLNYMHAHQINSVADKSNFAALSKLPEITLPKLTAESY